MYTLLLSIVVAPFAVNAVLLSHMIMTFTGCLLEPRQEENYCGILRIVPETSSTIQEESGQENFVMKFVGRMLLCIIS